MARMSLQERAIAIGLLEAGAPHEQVCGSIPIVRFYCTSVHVFNDKPVAYEYYEPCYPFFSIGCPKNACDKEVYY